MDRARRRADDRPAADLRPAAGRGARWPSSGCARGSSSGRRTTRPSCSMVRGGLGCAVLPLLACGSAAATTRRHRAPAPARAAAARDLPAVAGHAVAARRPACASSAWRPAASSARPARAGCDHRAGRTRRILSLPPPFDGGDQQRAAVGGHAAEPAEVPEPLRSPGSSAARRRRRTSRTSAARQRGSRRRGCRRTHPSPDR